ncbi:MAG: leucine-rich repeat protein [Mycoplasma sp.]
MTNKKHKILIGVLAGVLIAAGGGVAAWYFLQDTAEAKGETITSISVKDDYDKKQSYSKITNSIIKDWDSQDLDIENLQQYIITSNFPADAKLEWIEVKPLEKEDTSGKYFLNFSFLTDSYMLSNNTIVHNTMTFEFQLEFIKGLSSDLLPKDIKEPTILSRNLAQVQSALTSGQSGGRINQKELEVYADVVNFPNNVVFTLGKVTTNYANEKVNLEIKADKTNNDDGELVQKEKSFFITISCKPYEISYITNNSEYDKTMNLSQALEYITPNIAIDDMNINVENLKKYVNVNNFPSDVKFTYDPSALNKDYIRDKVEIGITANKTFDDSGFVVNEKKSFKFTFICKRVEISNVKNGGTGYDNTLNVYEHLSLLTSEKIEPGQPISNNILEMYANIKSFPSGTIFTYEGYSSQHIYEEPVLTVKLSADQSYDEDGYIVDPGSKGYEIKFKVKKCPEVTFTKKSNVEGIQTIGKTRKTLIVEGTENKINLTQLMRYIDIQNYIPEGEENETEFKFNSLDKITQTTGRLSFDYQNYYDKDGFLVKDVPQTKIFTIDITPSSSTSAVATEKGASRKLTLEEVTESLGNPKEGDAIDYHNLKEFVQFADLPEDGDLPDGVFITYKFNGFKRENDDYVLSINLSHSFDDDGDIVTDKNFLIALSMRLKETNVQPGVDLPEISNIHNFKKDILKNGSAKEIDIEKLQKYTIIEDLFEGATAQLNNVEIIYELSDKIISAKTTFTFSKSWRNDVLVDDVVFDFELDFLKVEQTAIEANVNHPSVFTANSLKESLSYNNGVIDKDSPAFAQYFDVVNLPNDATITMGDITNKKSSDVLTAGTLEFILTSDKYLDETGESQEGSKEFPISLSYSPILDIEDQNVKGFAWGYENLIPEIEIPKEIQTIDAEAFKDNKNIESIIFEDFNNITMIGEDAFSGCSNLTIDLVVADGVEAFGDRVFNGVKGKISVPLLWDDELTGWVDGFDGSYIVRDRGQSTYGTIGVDAFVSGTYDSRMDHVQWKEFLYGKKIDEIGENDTIDEYVLSTLVKKGALDTFPIGTKYTMESGSNEDGKTLFVLVASNCYNEDGNTLRKPLYQNVQVDFANVDHELFKFNPANGTIYGLADNYTEQASWNDGNIIIPEKLLDIDVVKIAEDAFKKYEDIKSITINGKVKEIGASSLIGQTVILSEETQASIVSVGERAFEGTTIDSIKFGASLESIDEYAFFNSKIKEVSFDANSKIVRISNYAFNGCGFLTKISALPNSIKEIGAGAFGNCYRLSGDIIIPSGVDKIGAEAFYNCASIDSISIDGSKSYGDEWSVGYDGTIIKR